MQVPAKEKGWTLKNNEALVKATKRNRNRATQVGVVERDKEEQRAGV